MAIELFDRMRALLFARGASLPATTPDVKPPAKMDEELARNAMTILSRWTAPARSFNPDDDLIGLKGMEIYEKMRHDDQVKAALAFKKSAVLSTGWEVTPASDKKPDVQAADFVTWCLENLDPLYGSIDDILYEVLSALDFGFCLHGDTLIHTLSGDRPIKDLVGRRPWVFSWEGDTLRPAQAKRVWRSKRNALCVKVTYEWWARGQRHENSIICTDSHPFMLLDGSYMRARQLRPGDRLTPFSQKINHPGYGKARATVKASGLAYGTGAWQKRSQWVWEQLHGPQPNGTHVHHRDNDGLNDEPENLQLLAGRRHKSLSSRQWWRTAPPEAIAALKQKRVDAVTPARRVQLSQQSREANLRTWQDPTVRAKRIAGIKRSRAVLSPEALANIRAAAQDPERRRKVSEGLKAALAARRERERNHRVVSVEPWGVADVYDMEVPGYHNFAANNVFVHNSLSELVLKKLDEGPYKGKIGLRTIKVRKPHEFIFDVDEFDNLKPDGIRQSWTMGKGMPIDKFLIFSYQREFGNFRGVSDLRAAYRGWWLKDNLWSWTATYAERFSIPLRTATYPPGTYPEGHPMRALITAIHNALDNLQANTALTYPSDFAIDFHEASGQGVNVLKFLFDHCNLAITRSILMPSQLGFSAEGATGSYARSKVQFDAFMLIIDDLRRDIAQDVLNGQLIPRLVGWNLGGLEALPKFDWLPFTESDEINLLNAWMLATQYGLVTPTPEDENHIRAATKFPEREITPAEEKAVKAKNDAAVKKIQDEADATLSPPEPGAGSWGSPQNEWGGGGGGGASEWDLGPSEPGGWSTGESVPRGWDESAGGAAGYAVDPEFESKHPRGGKGSAQGGQWVAKGARNLAEFQEQALANMKRLSRTAKGISDTSVSADKPKLVTEGADLAQKAEANFLNAVKLAWEKRETPLDTPARVEALVTELAATVSKDLLPEGASLWRQHETDPKFGQVPTAQLPFALGQFYREFADRMNDIQDDPIATAAWVEREFDAKIHGLADGSGRTTKLLSAIVLARAGLPQPNYPDKQTYYKQAVKGPGEWEQYYRTLFPKPSLGQRLIGLPARAIQWLKESERIASKPLPWTEGGWGTLGGYAARTHAVDPEFERLHPRGPTGTPMGGKWIQKPGETQDEFEQRQRTTPPDVPGDGEGTDPQTPKPDGKPAPMKISGDAGVTADVDLASLDPRTQPHEYAKAYTLALAAAGDDRAATKALVDQLPPQLKELLTPTWYKYTDENGKYTPERAAKHEEIIQKYLDAYQPDEMTQQALAREDVKPLLYLLAGGTGAGKTTTLGMLTRGSGNHDLGVKVASDDIKTDDIPEWAALAASDYWEAGAGVVHEESSTIAKKLLDRALAAKKDVVYDATLRNYDKAKKLFDKARKLDYEIQLLYVDTDADLALERAKVRAEQSKRYVPENFARVSHEHAPKAFREYSELLDRWLVYRSGQKPGEKPRRISAAGKGQRITVEDKAIWNEFIRKMGGKLPSSAVHLAWRWSENDSVSVVILPATRSAGSVLTLSPASFSTAPPPTRPTWSGNRPAPQTLADNQNPSPSPKTRELDFAHAAATLDTLESDAAARLKGTLAKVLDALQSVVNKKIQTGDLSLGFVKALDLKHRAEMTAAVREFLAQAYRSGRDQGTAAYAPPPTYARRTHRTPQGLPPEKALQFFEEKSLWITGVLKQRLLDEAKSILYNAIKGGANSPTVLLQLREVFDPYLGDASAIDPAKKAQVMPYRLETILRTNATEAYNEGLKDSVQDLVESGYVVAFRSSAVLDDRTTHVCEFLHSTDDDGVWTKCYRPNSDELEVFTPPRHFNCRSMLVAVTTDDGPVEFITPAEIGEALELIPPGFGGRQRG